jgi:hypothetical protein
VSCTMSTLDQVFSEEMTGSRAWLAAEEVPTRRSQRSINTPASTVMSTPKSTSLATNPVVNITFTAHSL